MKPVPIPSGVAEDMGGYRLIITEPGLQPCEYVITSSEIYPGRPCVHALVDLDLQEREAVSSGAKIWLTLDGGELPWSMEVDR